MNEIPAALGRDPRRSAAGWRSELVDAASSIGRSFRIALGRHPRLRSLLACAAAGCAAWSFAAALGQAADARDAWGDTVEVWVVDRPISPGDRVSVERRRYPAVVVPPDALTSPPSGAVALGHLSEGEVVTLVDVVDEGGPVALAPPGSVVVALADPLLDHADPGTSVIVVAEGVVLAAEGIVTASAGGVIHVAVPAAEAAMVAAAAHQHLASVLIPAPPAAVQD